MRQSQTIIATAQKPQENEKKNIRNSKNMNEQEIQLPENQKLEKNLFEKNQTNIHHIKIRHQM